MSRRIRARHLFIADLRSLVALLRPVRHQEFDDGAVAAPARHGQRGAPLALGPFEGTLREDRWTGESFTDVYLLGKLNHGQHG